MTDQGWWRNHAKVLALGQWLVDQGHLIGEYAVLDYFEKPWHWQNEYRQMRLDERTQDLTEHIGRGVR